MAWKKVILVVGLVLFAAASCWAGDDADLATKVVKKREMVVTANPLATKAGEKILKIGGTAVDAMIAVQTVLGLVEPQSSGIGGGAFVVYYDAKTGETTTFDAREKAPMATDEYRFDGLGWSEAWQSGLSVGVPGVPKLMEHMYVKYGKLPWQRLFVPAKRLAQKGFKLTERTSSQVSGLLERNSSCLDGERIYFRDPAAFEYFVNTEDCTAKPAGTWMRNRAYAHILKKLARCGSDAFYHGPVADDIVAAVQGDLHIPGDMSVDDLANYEVVERPPVCIDYRGHTVCGMGPPSSGGLAVGQMLGILNNFELNPSGYLDTETVHLFAQAGRLAFADRGKYVGDSDFITVPVEGMLDTDYLEGRADLIVSTDMGTAEPGEPEGIFDPYAADTTTKNSGTSHISIVDRYGNALSMTTSVESSFGSGLMVRGFLLNNQLTDFSFAPTDDEGVPVANRVQAGKRPRSSMSPTIVFDEEGQVALVTGSPGGSRIIGYTAQSIINVLDFGLDPQEAINVPHYTNRNGSYTQIEEPIPGVTLDYDAVQLQTDLKENFSYADVRIDPLTSGLSVIQVVQQEKCTKGKKGKQHKKGRKPMCCEDTLLIGGADMRRDGSVGGY